MGTPENPKHFILALKASFFGAKIKRNYMISFTPIWAIVLRHIRLWKRDINFLLGGFYWPVLDIIIWGFLGAWIQQSQTAQFHNYEVAALLGILLWQVIGR